MEEVDVHLDPIRRAQAIPIAEVHLPAGMLAKISLEAVPVPLRDQPERALDLPLLAKHLVALHRQHIVEVEVHG